MQYLPGFTTRLVDFSLYRNLWTAITGIRISLQEFLRCGERCHVLERYMNTREGIGRKDDTLPSRLTLEHRHSDPGKQVVPLERMLGRYYDLRDYDSAGIPRDRLLKKLSIL